MIGAGATAAVGFIASGAFAQDVKGPAGVRHRSEGVVHTQELPGLAGKEKRSSVAKRWYAAAFPSMSALVNYANTPPAQGPGEIVVVGQQADGAIHVLIFF